MDDIKILDMSEIENPFDVGILIKIYAVYICDGEGKMLYEKHRQNLLKIMNKTMRIPDEEFILEQYTRVSDPHMKVAVAFHTNDKFKKLIKDYNNDNSIDDMIVPYIDNMRVFKYFINDHKNI